MISGLTQANLNINTDLNNNLNAHSLQSTIMAYNNPANSEPLPTALAVGLSDLGRTRGSAATPVSPAPSRDLQSAVNQFKQMNFDDASFENTANTRPGTPSEFTDQGSSSSQQNFFAEYQSQQNQQFGGFDSQTPQGFPPSAQGFGYWNQGFNTAYQPPPGAFKAPSTTRQGTTKNPIVTAPNPSTLSFPSFSRRESSGGNMISRGNKSSGQGTREMNHVSIAFNISIAPLTDPFRLMNPLDFRHDLLSCKISSSALQRSHAQCKIKSLRNCV